MSFFTQPPDHSGGQASFESLLTCFFTTCGKEFSFLEKDHGFSSFSGLADYRKGRRVFIPFMAPASVTPPFEAVTLYEKRNTFFEISYGGDQYAINLYICYDRINRFHLREIFQAARKSSFARLEASHITQPASLEQALAGIGHTVKKHVNFLTKPNPKITQRTITIREKLMEQKIREQYRKDMEEAALQAVKAFVNKDYRRVVELFTPYETHLSFAHLKKLDLARRKLLSV